MNKADKDANQALKDFIRYSSSPWRIVWTNFVAGVFRGLGAVIGASVLIAFLIWALTLFVDVPLIGKYAEEVKTTVMGYVDDTNYNDEFARLESVMRSIKEELSEEKESKAMQ